MLLTNNTVKAALALALVAQLSAQAASAAPKKQYRAKKSPKVTLASVTSSVSAKSAPVTDSISSSAAAPQMAASTSTAPANPSLIDKFSIVYYGAFSGPALSKISAYTPDSDGSQTSAQNLDGALMFGFRPAKNTNVGVNINATLEPVMGQGLKFNDPALKISQKEVINTGKLKLALELRSYLPLTQASQDAKLITQLRAIQTLTYDIGRFNLGTYTYVKYNAFSERAKGSYDSKVYLAPFANYQMNEKLAATLWCDLVQAANVRGQSLTDLTNPAAALQAGVNWDITPNIGLNPFINVVPGNVSFDSSYAGFIISAKFL